MAGRWWMNIIHIVLDDPQVWMKVVALVGPLS